MLWLFESSWRRAGCRQRPRLAPRPCGPARDPAAQEYVSILQPLLLEECCAQVGRSARRAPLLGIGLN
jgi:hypothetical protein